MTFTCFSVLRVASESLKYRFYNERVGEQSFIGWWTDIVLKNPVPNPLYLLCRTETDTKALSQILGNEGRVVVLTMARQTILGAIGAAIRSAGTETAVVLPFGFCLAPPLLLQHAIDEHRSSKNQISFVVGLPTGCVPIIANSDFIAHAADSAEADGFLQPKYGSRFPPNVIDARRYYDLNTSRLPRSVSIQHANDFSLLTEVEARCGSKDLDQNPLARLEIWKEISLSRSLGRRKNWKQTVHGTPPAAKQFRRPRVLFISCHCGFAGAERVLCELVRQIDGEKFDKYCLVGQAGLLKDTLERSGAVVTVSDFDFSENTVDSFLYLGSIIRNIRPDVIHLNGLDGFAILCAAQSLNIPMVQHVHMLPGDKHAEYFRAASAVITVSEFVSESVRQFDIEERVVKVVHNGIDIEYFHPDFLTRDQARVRLKLPLDCRLILAVSRIDPQKRLDVLIEAFAKVRESDTNVHLAIIGEVFQHGKTHDQLLYLAGKLGITENISWLPFTDDMRVVYSAADLLVLTSRQEALPMCILEAMAMGLPVVVNKSGGVVELVIPDQTGLIVRTDDATGFAAGILTILADDEVARRLANRAKLHARSSFDSRRMAEKVTSIYYDIISNVGNCCC